MKPPEGVELRVRRSADELSNLDARRLRRAFKAMMQVSDDRGYQHWAGIHGLPMPIHGHHGQLSFLPWHRAYLLNFETALREFESGVTLPWWDWGGYASRQRGIPSLYSEFFVEGERNPLYGAEIPAGEWSDAPEEAPASTTREPNPPEALPTDKEVERLLQIPDFPTFADQLEMVHNHVHVWVGGTNSSVPYASYDPFFWTYQASIDRIWWLWQQAHSEVEPQSEFAEQPLAPFGVSVADVWDATPLGYSYANRRARPTGFRAGAASDRPSTADELNFADYAQAFAEIIASPQTTPPLTIGIYGSWGIGKSSLLQMIAEEFPEPDQAGSDGGDPDEIKVHVVQFNAWEYSSSEMIWPSLVRRIMEQMEAAAQWGYFSRLADTFKRNLARLWRRQRNRLVAILAVVAPLAVLAIWKLDFDPAVIGAAVVAIGIPGLIKLGAEAASNPVSRWAGALVDQEEYGNELPYMREIHSDLSFLVRQMGGDAETGPAAEEPSGGPRILVMIDDLDRCEPEKAVEVLQAINLLLDFRVFVVCLGIDARIITAAVDAHYKEVLGDAGASGFEYLDKIVQIPFLIPTASELEVKSFIEAQMPVSAPAEASELTAMIDAPTGGDEVASGDGDYGPKLRASSVPDPNGSESPPEDLTTFDRVEVEGFQDLAPFVNRNPRHIKRLINVYRMVRTLAARRGVDAILDDPRMTIAWIAICAQWPYTVSLMLKAFEVVAEGVDRDGEYPAGDPLPWLFERVKGDVDPAAQSEIDCEIPDLEKLLNQTEMSWEELRIVQAYTLNFNPAIEKALQQAPASA
ncbi:MAG TPA: P-loop NTPase fold protein [Solirubrobacterales bacterium]|nr:P-loop NTPase fold protein [Solirubrobacterales bacterium]